MASVVEKARKQSGISSLEKGYPSLPKQRGAAFWSRFTMAVRVHTDNMVDENLRLASENAELAKQLGRTERELSRIRESLATHRVGDIATSIPGLESGDRMRLIGAVKISGNAV